MKSKNGGKGMSDDEVKKCVSTLSNILKSPTFSYSIHYSTLSHNNVAQFSLCRFIDRYIPGYIFFSGGIHSGYVSDPETNLDNEKTQNPKWLGRSLQMTINEEREVVGVEEF